MVVLILFIIAAVIFAIGALEQFVPEAQRARIGFLPMLGWCRVTIALPFWHGRP